MKKVKKPKSKARTIVEWVLTGFFLTLLVGVGAAKIYESKTGKMVFGAQYPKVLTDSMEDTYMVGDAIKIIKAEPSELKKGDDITFYWTIQGQEVMMTHRLTKDPEYYADAAMNDGYHYTFTTSGINKQSTQCGSAQYPGDCTYQTQVFHEDKLIGKVKGVSKFMTGIYKILDWKGTIIFLILIPALYVMTTSVVDLFKNLEEQENEQELAAKAAAGQAGGAAKPVPNGEDPLKELSKADRERLKKELLDELLKKGQK